ncbi:MAG: class I SAM-dependent methyltransferase [Ignavibacteria bacterium]|nr:class I SAM-dependent methyltransferase [Ignavibacteria bacterium]
MQNITEILAQKKWPPHNYSSAYVRGFDHWFLPDNINRIDKTLKKINEKAEVKKCLDIGFGNPIVLQRELRIFPQCNGLYVTLRIAFEKGINKSILYEGNCYQIPFDPNEFDLVSAYALLHIIPDISEFYKEAYRVLKKGGCLYTDGDRNIFLIKIMRKFKMIQYRLTGNKNKFEYWSKIFITKENFHQEGIDYVQLKIKLLQIGFSNVVITPWFSANPNLDKNIVYHFLKNLLVFFKFNFFSTHIQILAIK